MIQLRWRPVTDADKRGRSLVVLGFIGPIDQAVVLQSRQNGDASGRGLPEGVEYAWTEWADVPFAP